MLTYAAVAGLATVLFVFLHHLGNQLPYDLALQRFDAEAGRSYEAYARGLNNLYEFCEVAETVVGGARDGGYQSPDNALVQALRLSTIGHLDRKAENCFDLDAAANGEMVPERPLRTRYWWGSKALYAIGLRWFSVHEIRELTRIGIYAAYLLLAVSLLLFAPQTLPATAPLLAFGALLSGVGYWTDVANGTPYLWMVLSVVLLVWLMRGPPSPNLFSGRAPVYCFAAGTVSSYLWFGDGHAFVVITWIGLLVWFGHDALSAVERTKRAVSCIALYAAGFVACFGLGLVVKTIVLEDYGVWQDFWRRVLYVVFEHRGATEASGAAARLGVWLESYYVMAWPNRLSADVVPTSLAASSLAAAVGFAVFRAWRGRPDLLWGVLWIVGLLVVNVLSFLMPNDTHYRVSMFMFLPLALCWSCFVLSVRTMNRKLSSAMIGVVLVVSSSVSWHLASEESRAIDGLIAGVEDARPAVSSVFDVYLDLDGNRLVYLKDDCGTEDVEARFLAHSVPVDETDLSIARRPRGFDNLDFNFERNGGLRAGGRCAAARALPDYEIASIRTGQYGHEPDSEWSAWIAHPRRFDDLIAGVADARPLVRSVFDVYLDGNRLVYVKDDCGAEDVDAWFTLHLFPVEEADLPDARRLHGFDNLDFVFERYGYRVDGRCAAARALPDYEIASIRTGQRYDPEPDSEWSEWAADPNYDSTPDAEWDEWIAHPERFDDLIAGVADARLLVRSVFDVYLDGNRLVYVKDGCGAEDVDSWFTLHLFPAEAADLPDYRRPHGFDNLDFAFERHGYRFGGRCAAVRALPDYEIETIRTGQFHDSAPDPEWIERVAHPRRFDDLIAGVADARLLVRSVFDVYLDGNRLVYVKDGCGAEDVDSWFTLHLFPVEAADLPDHRRPHGFDNLDFAFERHGYRFGGRCAAVRALPDYEIETIRTGQFHDSAPDPEWIESIDLNFTVPGSAALPPAGASVRTAADRAPHLRERVVRWRRDGRGRTA